MPPFFLLHGALLWMLGTRIQTHGERCCLRMRVTSQLPAATQLCTPPPLPCDLCLRRAAPGISVLPGVAVRHFPLPCWGWGGGGESSSPHLTFQPLCIREELKGTFQVCCPACFDVPCDCGDLAPGSHGAVVPGHSHHASPSCPMSKDSGPPLPLGSTYTPTWAEPCQLRATPSFLHSEWLSE